MKDPLTGYLVERQTMMGWLRVDTIFWRLRDAKVEVDHLLQDSMCKAARIVQFTVDSDSVLFIEQTNGEREVTDAGLKTAKIARDLNLQTGLEFERFCREGDNE